MVLGLLNFKKWYKKTINYELCLGGGTGRRKGLKIPRP